MIHLSYIQNASPDPTNFWKGFLGHSGTPEPIVKLALHIFSVCANSASCERLFSVFGNILTKLRNRLGTKTLTLLADEHLSQQTAEHMKRRFGQIPEEISSPASDSAATPAATPNAVPSEASSTLPDTSPNSIEDDNEFQALTANMEAMVDDDDIALEIDSAILRFPSQISITIFDLFELSSDSWVGRYYTSAVQSLNEELQFYELVDADNEGVGGIDTAIDETLGSLI